MTKLLAECRAAVGKSPQSAAAWGKLGMAFFAHDFAEEAKVCFATAERLDARDARWPYFQGLVRMESDLDAAIRRFTNDTKQRYNFLSHDRDRPILEPQRLFLSDEDFFAFAKPFARLALPANAGGGWSTPLPNLAIDRHADDPVLALRAYLNTTPNRVLFAAESAGRRETLLQLLADNRLRPTSSDSFNDWLTSTERFALGVAPLSSGFAVPAEGIAIVTETELYGPLARRAGRRRLEPQSPFVAGQLRRRRGRGHCGASEGERCRRCRGRRSGARHDDRHQRHP